MAVGIRTKTTDFLLPHPVIPAHWLENLRRIWNECLELLYWRQYWLRVQACGGHEAHTVPVKIFSSKVTIFTWTWVDGKEKEIKKTLNEWALSCPIGRFERLDKKKSWDAKNQIWRPFLWQVSEDGYVCSPVDADHETYACDGYWVKAQWYLEQPIIEDYSVVALRKPFARKRCQWLRETTDIPQTYVNDFIELNVVKTWDGYQKGEKGRPRFKGNKKSEDKINTIPCQSFRAVGKLSGSIFSVPGVTIVSSEFAANEKLMKRHPDAIVDDYFMTELQTRLLDPLQRLGKTMHSTPEAIETLQTRLQEGERFQQVIELLEEGVDLPDVSYPLGAEIREVNGWLQKEGFDVAIALLQKRIAKAKPEKAARLEQVFALLEAGEALPEPHPLRSEVLAAQKLLEEKGVEGAIAKLKVRVADRTLDASVEHLTIPGAFSLSRVNDKDYIHITHSVQKDIKPNSRSVGIDVGLKYLYTTSTGVIVKHQDFSHEQKRIENLQRELSDKKHGSNNYLKLQQKINKISGRVKRSKKKRQEYHASWQTDANGEIAVKHYKAKESVAVPLPRPNLDGSKYLPNGRTKNRKKNRELQGAALGQFVALLGDMAQTRDRNFEKVEIEVEANANDVLAISSLPENCIAPSSPESEAQSSSSAWEGDGATHSMSGERLTLTPDLTKSMQASTPAPKANTPKKPKFKGRNRKLERAIG